jgi:chaperonin GroES
MDNIKPLSDHLFIEKVKEEKISASGIVIPETTENHSSVGKIVAAGPGKLNEDGDLIPISVKVGDTVVFTQYAPSDIKINDKEYLVVRESDVLAILTE